MIANQLTLIRREIWEHRAIWVTPIVIGIIMSLVSTAGIVTVSAFDREVELAIFSASNIAGDAERRAVLTVYFLGTSWLFLFAMGVLTIFYTLDSLYAERKDKSILFWRSLPVTDAETVVSKLLTAILLIPLVTVAAIAVTHIINVAVTAAWVSIRGGDAGHLIWGSVSFLDNWAAALIVALAGALWMSPFVGWFLFVSALTKRSPFLTAFMPLIVIPLIEWIVFRTKLFAEAVYGRGGVLPLFQGMDVEAYFDEERFRVEEATASLLTHLDIGKFLTSGSLWIGIIVCGLFVTAAIYVRRYRDESY